MLPGPRHGRDEGKSQTGTSQRGSSITCALWEHCPQTVHLTSCLLLLGKMNQTLSCSGALEHSAEMGSPWDILRCHTLRSCLEQGSSWDVAGGAWCPRPYTQGPAAASGSTALPGWGRPLPALVVLEAPAQTGNCCSAPGADPSS